LDSGKQHGLLSLYLFEVILKSNVEVEGVRPVREPNPDVSFPIGVVLGREKQLFLGEHLYSGKRHEPMLTKQHSQN
jgi:hypothetical protein